MNNSFRTIVFFLVLAFLSVPCFAQTPGKEIPYENEIRKIMSSVEYSGIDNILGEDIRLSLDLEKKIWTLHNAYHFDSEGNIVLSKGREGLCGSLSRYTYAKIKDIFPSDKYRIMFEKVKERDFFFTPQATHIVLTITDIAEGRKYLIDPSFKRYGAADSFDDYLFVSEENPQNFLESNRSPDKFFDVDSAAPILIRGDYLLVFSVESVDGKIDKNHFILAITAVKRHATNGDYVLGLKYIDGYLQTYSDEVLMRQLLQPEEVTRFQRRMLQWSAILSES